MPVPAQEVAPEEAFGPDGCVAGANAKPRAADDDPALLDDCAGFRRHPFAVHACAVSGAEVAHPDPAVIQQRQQRMPRGRVLIVEDDVTAEIAANEALGARALEALPQDPVTLRVGLLDQHHGVHCRASRKRSRIRLPDPNPTPWRASRLTRACYVSEMPTTVTSKS